MTKIYLKDRDWRHYDSGSVWGHIFIDGELITDSDLFAILENAYPNNIDAILKTFNGSWAFFAKIHSKALLISTDRIRSLPIFYTINDNKIIISDNIYSIKKEGNFSIKESSKEEFLIFSSTLGRTTLFKETYQLLAGDYIYINDKVSIKNWYTFCPTSENIPLNIDDQLQILDEKLVEAHNRLIKYANGRQLCIPLSGGLDSRVIVLLLNRFKYDNTFYYTYGNQKYIDSLIAKELSDVLKLNWQFIPYNKKIWRDCSKEKYYKDFLIRQFNFSNTPNIQEVPAIHALQANKHIKKDAIFVPGHCGAYMGAFRACLETSAFIVTRRHVDKKRLCAAAKTREDCQTVPQRSDGQRMGACTSSPAPCFWRRSEAQNRPA